MSNALHRKKKLDKTHWCKNCHKPMHIHKESYDSFLEELWICERCGREKWIKKAKKGDADGISDDKH